VTSSHVRYEHLRIPHYVMRIIEETQKNFLPLLGGFFPLPVGTDAFPVVSLAVLLSVRACHLHAQ
jgi:hypothetical protein